MNTISKLTGIITLAVLTAAVMGAARGGAPIPAPAPPPPASAAAAANAAPAERAADAPPLVAPVKDKDGDYRIGLPYAPAPELTAKDGVPKGRLEQFTMDSKDSKFYSGIAKGQTGVVPYMRMVFVYIPSQYVEGTAAPVIVAQDGRNYRNNLPTILDNMIAEKRVPPMIAVLINNGGGDSLGSERGLEYDTVSGKYAEFVEAEVLPRVESEYKVKISKDPDARCTLGSSSGAAAAYTMAWYHPEWYHRVISYSGTFVNQQSPMNPESPRGAWEYHQTIIPNSPVKPIRLWFEVGQNDNGFNAPEAGLHNWVIANQHMLEVMKSKGYHYQFVFAEAARHVDARVVAQTLPEAIEWVWQGYAAK